MLIHIAVIVVFLLILPNSIDTVMEMLNGGGSLGYIKPDVGIVFLGPPILLITSIPFVLKYFCVLLDYVVHEQKTIIIRGLERPNIRGLQDVPLFNKDVVFSYWRTKDLNGRNKTLYISNVYMREVLHGETTRHWYKVTYYRFSKMVVSIEKAKGIKQKITNPGK